MSSDAELQEARRVLAFVHHRSRFGLFSFRRSVRDAALSDVNYWTGKYAGYWQPPRPPGRNVLWCGERP